MKHGRSYPHHPWASISSSTVIPDLFLTTVRLNSQGQEAEPGFSAQFLEILPNSWTFLDH